MSELFSNLKFSNDNYKKLVELLYQNETSLTANTYTEVDAFIFAELSGSRFSEVFNGRSDTMTIEEAANSLASFEQDDDKKALYLAIANSPRYKNVKVSDPINTEGAIYNDSSRKNAYHTDFKALTYHLPDGTMFVSYAGTGGSTYSWIEDFRLSYTNNGIGAQRQASGYFAKVAEKYSDERIILSGYSKGGNLQLYAGADNYDKYGNRIIKLFNFDGPGLRKDMIYNNDGSLTDFGKKYQEAKEKLIIYSPRNSFVGKLMGDWDQYQYMGDQDAIFPSNHDFKNWNLSSDGSFHFESASDNSHMSKEINIILDTDLALLSDKECEEIADFLEGFCMEYGYNYIGDFSRVMDNPMESLNDLLTYYGKHPSPGVKKMIDILTNPANVAAIMLAYIMDHQGKDLNIEDTKNVLGIGATIAISLHAVTRLLYSLMAIYTAKEALISIGEKFGEFYAKMVEIDKAVKGWITEKERRAIEWTTTKMYSATKWLDEKRAEIYHFCTKTVPQKVDKWLDTTCGYINQKLESLKIGSFNVFSYVRSTISTAFDNCRGLKGAVMNSAPIINICRTYGSCHYSVVSIDTANLRVSFNKMTNIANRINTLDSSLHSLYGHLCLNNIKKDDAYTSLKNLYHLVRSDIIVNDAATIKNCRMRLYHLIDSYETSERKMIDLIN